VRNFSFTNVRVNDVNDLVDGTSVHPDKPLDGLVLKNISGESKRGIRLANIRNADISNISVSVIDGPLLGVCNVYGKGFDKADNIKFPHEIQPPIPEPEPAYQLM
jgi:hypothetical protein